MIEPRKLFSTQNISKWVPYYKKDGERVIDAMSDNKVNYNDFYVFFKKHGDMLLEFIEKMTIDELRGEAYKSMSPTQAAFIGHTALLSLMKEISAEIYADGEVKKAKK